VSARKNLNETAFFSPQLLSDSNGVVRMSFTMPEALTRWRFLGFAHDRSLRSGFLEGHAVTAKDLMVQPNPPRFLREGDTVEFTVKVSNKSDRQQTGSVRLNFTQTGNGEAADALLGNTHPEQDFDVPANESRSYSWRITVPDNTGFLTYKAVAASASVSDGEEGALPVLSRRILVTESLALPIRGPATKNFKFDKLADSGKSETLRHQGLTVQVVSNPAWYAVLALPYLMEFPYECSEQIFNRAYANSLARHIANSDPKIRRIFDQWKNTPALDSPLEKNQELKAVMLEETPWVRQARNESEARRNVGILFDDYRLTYDCRMRLRSSPDATCGRFLALVSRRPAQRLHHAIHYNRVRPTAPSWGGCGCLPGRKVPRAPGRLDGGKLRPHSTRLLETGGIRPEFDRCAVSLRSQLLPKGRGDRARAPKSRGFLPETIPEILA
jgi:hypothetical protein